MATQRRIRYRFSIDQAALYSAGVRGVDYIDIAIYEFICGMMKARRSNKMLEGNRVFVQVYSSAILEQMPYLSRSGRYSKESVCDRITALVNCGLLERHPANQKMGKTFYSPSELADSMTEMTVLEDDHEADDLGGISPTPWWNSTDPSVESHRPLGGISPTVTNKNITIQNTTEQKQPLERETHAQEVEQKPILEQTNHKAEEVAKPQITTLDIPFCEGHKMKIAVHEYPKQPKGAPFIHPDLVGRIPMDKRIELWWALYGIKQAEMKVEFEMIQAGIADDATYAEIYRHTFLYVAVTDTRFRSKPLSYWKNKEWKDDIIDRREKKEVADSTGVAITNAPAQKSRIEREAEEREIQRKIEAKLEAEHEAYISGIEKALEERDRRAANK